MFVYVYVCMFVYNIVDMFVNLCYNIDARDEESLTLRNVRQRNIAYSNTLRNVRQRNIAYGALKCSKLLLYEVLG